MKWLVGAAAIAIFYGTCVLISQISDRRERAGEYEDDYDGVPWGDV